jgi:uncharacterized protein YjbJ (UPF0337 family)
MITRQELEGSWNTVKGKLQEKWGQLTDHDLTQFKGDMNQLIGTIQSKTGETRRVVEDFLQSAVGYAKEYAGQASEIAADRYRQAKEGVEAGMHEAEEMVRRSPMESVAVAFGAGLIAGVITGLVLKSSRA